MESSLYNRISCAMIKYSENFKKTILPKINAY